MIQEGQVVLFNPKQVVEMDKCNVGNNVPTVPGLSYIPRSIRNPAASSPLSRFCSARSAYRCRSVPPFPFERIFSINRRTCSDVASGCGYFTRKSRRSEEHTSELQSPTNLV